MQRCTFEGVSNVDDAIENPRGRSLGISSSRRSGGTCSMSGEKGETGDFSLPNYLPNSATALLANRLHYARTLRWSTRLFGAEALGSC